MKSFLDDQSPSTALATPFKITAKKVSPLNPLQIYQADIFRDLEVIEAVKVIADKIYIEKISFPFAICLNQACDLEHDFENRSSSENKQRMLHAAVAPIFLFEHFLQGKRWGDVFIEEKSQKRTSTEIKKIMDNQIPRYHFLKFPDTDAPELIIDFKHFFTVSFDYLYSKIDTRFCSMDVLFREQVSHRFSYFISRIGLPVS